MTGGLGNAANADGASVSGGVANTASGIAASVSGGENFNQGSLNGWSGGAFHTP